MIKSKVLRLCGTVVALTLMVIWPISARVEECGSRLRGDGVLQSHGFPNSYPNNHTCDWTFEAGPEDDVKLTFTHFDVEDSAECIYDYLQIYAMGYSPKFCGSGVHKVSPGGIINAKGPVRLVFKSDTSETKKGFRLTYSITPPESEGEEVISCDSEPCKNEATCVDIDDGEVACFCGEGFEGDFCEINIDECASNPCQNGGTCIDEVDRYSCDCPEGFLGDTCGVDADDCVHVECRNGGTCIDGPNSFECECVTGYTGWNCAQDIDECASGPCLNMGVCEDRIGFYECICYPGYSGVNCEIPPTTAAPSKPATTPAPPPTTPAPPQNHPEEHSPPEQLHETPSDPVEAPDESNEKPPEPTPPSHHPPEVESPLEDQIGEVGDHVPASQGETDTETVDGNILTTPNPPPALPSTTIATDAEDRQYPNSTIRNTTPENSDTETSGLNADNEEGSNTRIVIGTVAGLLGAIAVGSIAAQYWISKHKTKIEPIITVTPQEPHLPDAIEKEETAEQNDSKGNSKVDLVEEDLTGPT